MRDPNGARPLRYKTEHGYVLSSETCALDAIRLISSCHIDPFGEMVVIDDKKVRSIMYVPQEEKGMKALCVFEYIYFARSDSNIDARAWSMRLNMGHELVRNEHIADLKRTIPDSARRYVLLGYSRNRHLVWRRSY